MLGGPNENYELGRLMRVRDWREARLRATSDGRPAAVTLREYFCPVCLTLLEVDPWHPDLDPDEPVWNIEVGP